MDMCTRKRSDMSTDQIKQVLQSIRTYSFNGAKIRTACADDQIWMVFADVCRAVNFKNPRHEVKRFSIEETKKLDIGLKNTLAACVNKSGLWRFASLSSRPEPKELYAWAEKEKIFDDYDGR